MIKYVPQDTQVTFAEIPDEITLCINISCCPHRCPGCHSPYLQTDCGEELTKDILDNLIKHNLGITCVLFMGGDGDKKTLCSLAGYISMKYGLEVGWYSGEVDIDYYQVGWFFDYIKEGPYIEKLGPLNSPTTNQRLYKISRLYNQGQIIKEDITNKFWKHGNN